MIVLNNREDVKKVFVDTLKDIGFGRKALDMVVILKDGRVCGVDVDITFLGFSQTITFQTSFDKKELFLVEQASKSFKIEFLKYVVKKLDKELVWK